VLTVGVEEEFLLLEPGGAVAPVAADVVRLAGVDGLLVPEFMAYQVETATRVCTRLDELRSELVRLRLLAARGAERAGVRVVATGMPPYRAGVVGEITSDERYRELARRFPRAVSAGGACACQVHVGVPDRDLGVEVLARLRPWLATLLAMTANSPIVGGADSGWSSYRYRALLHWPTFRPPEPWASADRYDRTVRTLIAHGAAIDAASVYFLARLSRNYPTVEVRVADVCLTAEDALLFAAVVRALVAALIDDARQGRQGRSAGSARVEAGLLSAAHHGISTPRTRLLGGSRTAPGPLLDRLQAKIMPTLEAAGDAEEVRSGLDRLHRTGTGADRQRVLWASAATPRAFVASLADAAVPAASRLGPT
jgi:carboxylate-amine ligase